MVNRISTFILICSSLVLLPLVVVGAATAMQVRRPILYQVHSSASRPILVLLHLLLVLMARSQAILMALSRRTLGIWGTEARTQVAKSPTPMTH